MITLEKQVEVQRAAEQLFAQKPDWITFYREVLGLHGMVRRLYPTRESLLAFKQTDSYREILQLLTQLRQNGPVTEGEEPTRVITVRLPKSMHEALRVEAFEHHTSMNKLCISKLLEFIEKEKVPTET
ncbi:MAG: toxin-antitoxin system HicB family antitoxin [Planctomycetaceae bacterium]|nr:toxin-antitoxin system HicB family antitoxin [Planctomycetaceae bacterium]